MQHAPNVTVTHHFLDARLEATETRMDARVDRIEHKMDAFEQRMEGFSQDLRQVQQEMREERQAMQLALQAQRKETHDAIAQLRSENIKLFSNMKLSMFATGVGTVVAIILGVAALNSSVASNLLGAFDSGRQASQLWAHMQAQQQQHDKLLQDLTQQLQQQRQNGR